jgi:hypothetical protein
MFIPDPLVKKAPDPGSATLRGVSAAVIDISCLLQKPIMIMGADVSHAAPEHKVSFLQSSFV